ncbi:MAG: DUF6485 family protein [Candidatus Krumholzibacteriota bacterium]|nr:DUF6485 family protein [Candidatus Krumholzibacteriota bacterium]
MDCEKFDENLENCNCSYQGCPRKGNCCQCLQHHLKKRELPGCVFPDEIERTWDRSFERFIEIYS